MKFDQAHVTNWIVFLNNEKVPEAFVSPQLEYHYADILAGLFGAERRESLLNLTFEVALNYIHEERKHVPTCLLEIHTNVESIALQLFENVSKAQ